MRDLTTGIAGMDNFIALDTKTTIFLKIIIFSRLKDLKCSRNHKNGTQ
jgi:hypothetical protein